MKNIIIKYLDGHSKTFTFPKHRDVLDCNQMLCEDVYGLNYVFPIGNKHRKDVVECIVGEGIKKLTAQSFGYFSNLKRIVLPKSITHIGMFCFQDCQKLETIDFKGDLNNIIIYDEGGVIMGCDSLNETTRNNMNKIIKLTKLRKNYD